MVKKAKKKKRKKRVKKENKKNNFTTIWGIAEYKLNKLLIYGWYDAPKVGHCQPSGCSVAPYPC